MRDEVLSREVFDTLLEAKVVVERWRREYNHIRPHSSLVYGLLIQRALYHWERRYSAPFHLTPTHRRLTLEVVQSMGAGHYLHHHEE